MKRSSTAVMARRRKGKTADDLARALAGGGS